MSTGHVLEYQAPQTRPSSRFAWLGWAVYLAMSWTWCIGMFLPVLLVRDYGAWGWVIFVAPNILGASAMGWTISQTGSRAILRAHDRAITAFSFITIAFQIFFALWIFWRVGLPEWIGVATLALAAIMWVAMQARDHVARWIALIVLIGSLACWFAASRFGEFAPWITVRGSLGKGPPAELLVLSPVIVFGFLLCPYLDRTFHRVSSESSADDARRAFGTGFGLVFLAMMLFALNYFTSVVYRLEHPGANPPSLTFVAVFWCVQLAFTIAAHLSAVRSGESQSRGSMPLALASLAVGIGAWFAVRTANSGRDPGESIYRIFLGFYGLVFPAYVWLCVIPGRGRVAPDRRQLIVFAIAILLAAPMFWLGFIENRMFWLLPGLAVVLVARVAVPSRFSALQT